jgi:hypothetical protein
MQVAESAEQDNAIFQDEGRSSRTTPIVHFTRASLHDLPPQFASLGIKGLKDIALIEDVST